MDEFKCEYCNGNIHQKHVIVHHWYEDNLVIIKNVPVGVCHQCGERYYVATILDLLDSLAQKIETAQERISVPVMAFNL